MSFITRYLIPIRIRSPVICVESCSSLSFMVEPETCIGRLQIAKSSQQKIRREVVEAIYKRGALFVLSEVYQKSTFLLSVKRASNETFKNFESQFAAQVSNSNLNSSFSKLLDALKATVLLASSAIDNGQRNSTLAPASNSTWLDASARTEEYLAAVSYEKFASVLSQCDQVKLSASPPINVHAFDVEPKKGEEDATAMVNT